MFNIALDGNGNPMLPGTNSCGSGCRAIVTVNGDGSYAFNQECKAFLFLFLVSQIIINNQISSAVYALAQASKAILPKDDGGPWGQRIKVSVGGSLSWALRVGAYATGRASSGDWTRYALVVMNCTFTFRHSLSLSYLNTIADLQGTTTRRLGAIPSR